MSFRSLPNPTQAKLICSLAITTALLCAGLFIAAALIPAPPAVLPLAAVACIGCPILAAWDLPIAVAVLRAAAAERRETWGQPLDARALVELRRSLERLPETEHPLGG
jgi:hypothetical protein